MNPRDYRNLRHNLVLVCSVAMRPRKTPWLLLWIITTLRIGAVLSQTLASIGQPSPLTDIDIECNSDNILVTVSTNSDFNGMIYPKGLSKNSSCLTEYDHSGFRVSYSLPLLACNTMSSDLDDGVEYFNTVIIQPHHKLVTKQGRGFHVRCRYQTKNKVLISGLNASLTGITPLVSSALMPTCTMKIFVGNPEGHVIAENVKIGDHLTLVIHIDHQDVYGMKVTNCIVRDGLNWSEQPLINNDGCPVDEDIMGPMEYSLNNTKATVIFPAHKFPFTASVYYHCNVKLCLKADGSCEDVPPICDNIGRNHRRQKRQAEVQERGNLQELRRRDEDAKDLSVEVHSGLYVNEVDDVEEDAEQPEPQPTRSEDEFCVSTRKFAIGIAIAGILLTLAVIMLVACIIHRRRRRKGSSTAGSSIYSGPYSNLAYSRD